MEKVIEIQEVKFSPTMGGTDKWAIKTNKGFMTVWDGKLAEAITKRVGSSISAETKFDKTGKYESISAMNDASEGTVAKDLAPEGKTGMTARDEIIVAQVILKGAVELAKELNISDLSTVDVGRVMCEYVDELTGVYKKALSNLATL